MTTLLTLAAMLAVYLIGCATVGTMIGRAIFNLIYGRRM